MLHFLTTPADQAAYVDLAADSAPIVTLTHAETRMHRPPTGAEKQFTWVTARRTGEGVVPPTHA